LFAGNIKDDTIITLDKTIHFKSFQYNASGIIMTVVDGNVEQFD